MRHAVIYVLASEEAELHIAWCQQRAEDLGWTVTATVADDNLDQPLEERPGWQTVTDLLTVGRASTVLTWTASMVGPPPPATGEQIAAAYRRLTAVLRDRGMSIRTGRTMLPALADDWNPASTGSAR